jgi:hypothetical protein
MMRTEIATLATPRGVSIKAAFPNYNRRKCRAVSEARMEIAVVTLRRLSVILVAILTVSVALGQDSRGKRGGRGRNRGGDQSVSGRSSRHGGYKKNEAFLRRLDTNGNGMIDAEEVAGGYKSIVEGVLTKYGIELKYPIPLSKVSQAVQNSRSESGADDGSDESSYSDEPSSGGDSTDAQPKNGFGQSQASHPTVPGFGETGKPSGDTTPVAVSGSSATASTSSSTSSPAKSGDTPSASISANSDPPSDAPKRTGPKSGRFLTPKERLDKSLPDWFREKDGDDDGQVSMAEYAREWTDAKVAEFNRYDLNHDGIVTAAECLKAVEGPRHRSK